MHRYKSFQNEIHSRCIAHFLENAITIRKTDSMYICVVCVKSKNENLIKS